MRLSISFVRIPPLLLACVFLACWPGQAQIIRRGSGGGGGTNIFNIIGGVSSVASNYFLVGGTNIVIDTTVDGTGTNVTMTINTPGGGDSLWELDSGHMRTTGSTTNDWQFRYLGVPELIINTNGSIAWRSATNYLALTNGILTYSGGSPSGAAFSVYDQVSGKVGYFSVANAAGGISITSPELVLGNSTRSLRVNGSTVSGNQTGMQLGTLGIPWANYYGGNGRFTTNLTINGFPGLGGLSELIIRHGGTNDSIHFDSQASGIAGAAVGFSIESNTVPILGIGPGAQINFGEGGTNALYRSGSDLVVTNGSLTPAFKIINGNGDASIMSLDVNGFTTIDSSKGIISLLDNTAVFGNLVPSDRTRQLGLTNSSSEQWLNVAATRATIEGFDDGVGNYSQLAISMPLGTNGPIVFDSQSAGTAGPPVPMAFTNAPVVLPWFTKAQKTSLTPAEGMILFQTDNTPGIRIYESGAWRIVSTAADP